VGLANFVGLQVLYPNRRENCYTVAVSVAAAGSALFNLLMIPMLKQDGAILGTVFAELTGFAIQVAFAWRLLKDAEVFRWDMSKYFMAGTAMFLVVALIHTLFDGMFLSTITCVTAGIVVYGATLALLREKAVVFLMHKCLGKTRISA